ncbi:hypothetical protein FDW81_10570 [Pseudarthrobacter sp. NamB4]|nr:hypothetical protein FDW81_10570 [Pseudarthrobacter sp. NamB4]
MGADMVIALVLMTAFLWVGGTFAILSAIDRAERKARRKERRAGRESKRRVLYRPVVEGSRLEGKAGRHQPRKLRPH